MSSKLANSLLRAKSAETFLRRQGGRLALESLTALKSEVDRQARSNVRLASRLADRFDELSSLTGDPITEAFASASRARLLDHQGYHNDANRLCEKAVNLMRTAGLPKEAAVIQRQQLHALILLGRYDDALRTARAARRVLSQTDLLELAQLEANVGNIYYRLDRYKKALEHYDKALKTMATVKDDLLRAPTDFNRANILIEMDRPEEALKALEGAAAAFDRAGQSLSAAQVRFHIAYLQFMRGNYNIALRGFYETRDRLGELGSLDLVAFCNLDIAEVLLALNAFEDAIESASNARAQFGELGMPYDCAKALLVGALASIGLEQFDRAQSDLLEAREVFAQNRNRTFAALTDLYLAELALRRGDYAVAAGKASSSLRVFARHRLAIKSAVSRLVAARAAYKLGEAAKALRMAKAALGAVEGMFAPNVVYQCHHLLGLISRDRAHAADARLSFRRAVDMVEQMRGGIAADELKTAFLRDKIGIYEDAITACLDEGSDTLVEEAFRLVESSKSRALADLLARYVRGSLETTTRGLKRETMKRETRARLLKLIEELNWYSSQTTAEDETGKRSVAAVIEHSNHKLVRCERQVAQLFRRLEAEDDTFLQIQRMQSASTTDLQGLLEADETAIEYFITDNQVSAFVLSRERVRVARNIASKPGVERLLSGLRFQIEKFGYGRDYVEKHIEHLKSGIDEHLLELYEAILEPLEMMIATPRLVIIPHGPLHYLPFHALSDGRNYLVDLFEISYAPSAAVLKLCRESRISNERGKLVALGVVESDVPSIDDEIRALGEIFPAAVKLTGNRATRKNLIRFAPEARFLHIASHGYFRADNPMFSFLKLADSHLNFYSLLDLKLKAEMVTLSACETGVNAIFPGDELHGLMRGFLYAGAPSMVVSLWSVSDRSTAELMREMYGRISEGDTKRAALRNAQLRVKENYPHPYYWAPFILMGNPN